MMFLSKQNTRVRLLNHPNQMNNDLNMRCKVRYACVCIYICFLEITVYLYAAMSLLCGVTTSSHMARCSSGTSPLTFATIQPFLQCFKLIRNFIFTKKYITPLILTFQIQRHKQNSHQMWLRFNVGFTSLNQTFNEMNRGGQITSRSPQYQTKGHSRSNSMFWNDRAIRIPIQTHFPRFID